MDENISDGSPVRGQDLSLDNDGNDIQSTNDYDAAWGQHLVPAIPNGNESFVTLRSALSLINNREDSFIARYGAQIEEHNKAILAQVEINNAQAVEHRQAIALQAEINNDQTLAIQTLKECCEKLQERLTTSEKDRDTTKKENDVLKAKLKSNEQQIEHLCKTLGVQKVTDIRPRRSADRASTVIKDLKSKDEKQDEKINTINQKVGKLGEKVDQKVDKLDEKFDPTLGAIEWLASQLETMCLDSHPDAAHRIREGIEEIRKLRNLNTKLEEQGQAETE